MKVIKGFDRNASAPIGRCRHCNTAYEWAKGMVQLRYAHCHRCGRHLSQTTRLLTDGKFFAIESAHELAHHDCTQCKEVRIRQQFDGDLRRIARDLRYARTESARAALLAERKEIEDKEVELLRELDR